MAHKPALRWEPTPEDTDTRESAWGKPAATLGWAPTPEGADTHESALGNAAAPAPALPLRGRAAAACSVLSLPDLRVLPLSDTAASSLTRALCYGQAWQPRIDP